MTTSKEVQQNEDTLAITSALSAIVTAAATSAAELGDNRGTYLAGSLVLGAANRAAWSAQNASDRASKTQTDAQEFIDREGFEGNERQLQKFYDDMNFWAEQSPAYEAVYAACQTAYHELTGKPMPSQRPGKAKSTRVTTPPDQMLAALGLTPKAPAEESKVADANKAGTAQRTKRSNAKRAALVEKFSK